MINCVKIEDWKPIEPGKYLARYIDRYLISSSDLGDNLSEFGKEETIGLIDVLSSKKGGIRELPPTKRIIWISTKPVL